MSLVINNIVGSYYFQLIRSYYYLYTYFIGGFAVILQETVTKVNGLTLHVVPTKKFKTVTVTLKMKSPINREDVTKRSLIPFMLTHASEKYPTYNELRKYLDELYGLTLYVDLNKAGEYHICNFVMDIANEKFLSHKEPLLNEGLNLLNELLFKPLVEEEAFDNSILEQEKQNLKDKIVSIYDDKMRYSMNKLVEIMCADEPYSIPAYGYEEDLHSITTKNLYEYYQQMIAEDEVDLYVVGDVEPKEVEQIVSAILPFTEREPKLIEQSTEKVSGEPKVEKEDQNLKQGKLNIGFRTYTGYGDDDYFALQVANGIFGGFSHSKLFINVREKESLAYYATSRIASHKELMLVMSGIDPSNFDKASKIILDQLEQMKTGEFTDEEIIQTKAVLKNQVLEGLDTQRGTIDNLYYNVVARKQVPINDWLEIIENVTKEQIIQVSKKIQLDTTFFLV